MFNIILSIFLAISIFLASILWTVREMYVHEFRVTDVNFYSHALESETGNDREIRNFHIKMAKEWLKVSEDYRLASIHFSFMAAYMVFGTIFTVGAFVMKSLSFLTSILFFVVGIIFVAFSFLILLIRYSKKLEEKPLCSILEKIAWHLAERFPPLFPPLKPSHLKKWEEIQEIIDEREWIRKYIELLPYYNDLKRFFGYSEIPYP